MSTRDDLAAVIATGLDASEAETDFAFIVGGSKPTEVDYELADLILERFSVSPIRSDAGS